MKQYKTQNISKGFVGWTWLASLRAWVHPECVVTIWSCGLFYRPAINRLSASLLPRLQSEAMFFLKARLLNYLLASARLTNSITLKHPGYYKNTLSEINHLLQLLTLNAWYFYYYYYFPLRFSRVALISFLPGKLVGCDKRCWVFIARVGDCEGFFTTNGNEGKHDGQNWENAQHL